MWSLCDKSLCPGWEVESAAVSGDQPLWKAPKRLSSHVLAPWVRRVGCATGSPVFQGVGYPEKKLVYNTGSDGKGCGRLVLLIFPRVTRPVVCGGSWEGVWEGVGVKWGDGWGRGVKGWRSVDTREHSDIPNLLKPSHHSAQLRGCSSNVLNTYIKNVSIWSNHNLNYLLCFKSVG